PVILLNSHIDTVKPAQGWEHDPCCAIEENGRITGLGSNDAGASVVSLLAVFIHFYDDENLPFNLIYAATAEEEISGMRGVESLKNELPAIDLAIVGEPTQMQLAVAERGLLVLDCKVHGKSGHAARDEGENAIYKAIGEIEKLRKMEFERVSPVLGKVKTTVTQVNAGTQHNVIPDVCHFVVDVRFNEFYTNKEIFDIIESSLDAEVNPRSFRLNSSGIALKHPIVRRAEALGISRYGSPTTSDQAIMPWPSVKIGPGDSARSHTANEYIFKSEILSGIDIYIKLLTDLVIV
ncbi:MAG: M20/M25/M40 family metallo-hydrolase, partial [Prolixibacteraceae bacterium]|nr:M20/M25/M40 family metallo-hydrolase [Prolixibacteraceae bacterium]